MIRKVLLAGVAAVSLLGAVPARAQGLCVTATGPCSSLPQQLLDYARQFEQLQQEITTAEQEIKNTLALPGTVYRDLTGDIAQLTAITNQANMLAGNSLNMITALSSVGGYAPFTGPGMFHQQFSNENVAVSLALKTAAQAITQQNTQLQADATTLSALQTQALGTGGRQATQQTLAGLSASTAQSMQKLAQVMITAAQGQMTYQLAKRDEDGLINTTNDHDIEQGWLAACAMVAQAGGTSNQCTDAGTQ
jgi:P-type conjugative transfer protein TrbJ